MNITLFGSSLTSAYWNGAATYYRGICRALYDLGHRIIFVEQDIFDRQAHRDLATDPHYAEVRLCRSVSDLTDQLAQAATSDLIAVCSGIGANDELIQREVLSLGQQNPHLLTVFWDVDAPATLETARAEPDWYFRALVPQFDAILTYGGGPPVVAGYTALGARHVLPVYNAVDPAVYHPVAPQPELAADILFIGHRMPDREERFQSFFLDAARAVPQANFMLGGEGWGNDTAALPPNVSYLGFVPTAQHNVLYSSSRLTLNINRTAMALYGFSPPTRVFEAAGCGACLITDAWEGIEAFFTPDEEILIAATPADVARYVREVSPEQARAIGDRARQRALHDHSYSGRACLLHEFLCQLQALPVNAAP